MVFLKNLFPVTDLQYISDMAFNGFLEKTEIEESSTYGEDGDSLACVDLVWRLSEILSLKAPYSKKWPRSLVMLKAVVAEEIMNMKVARKMRQIGLDTQLFIFSLFGKFIFYLNRSLKNIFWIVWGCIIKNKNNKGWRGN